MSFFAELRERKVVRMAIIYAVAGWGVLQVADIAIGVLRLPEWTLRLTLTVIVLCFPLALLLSWFFKLTPRGLERENTPGRKEDVSDSDARSSQSVAILPFRLAGNSSEDTYLADGLSEQILHALARMSGLRVPSRHSCFKCAEQDADIRETADRLEVDNVLEGEIRREGDELLISADLVNARSNSTLWSGHFTQSCAEIPTVQDRIAGCVADTLRVPLDKSRNTPDTCPASMEAYHAYLKGRHALHQSTVEGCRQAVRHFRDAVALDESFAPAWAGLSLAYTWLARYGLISPPAEAFSHAREAAGRALRLDEDLAEAYLADADLKLSDAMDFAAAESSLRRALELDPNNADTHSRLGHYLSMMGRWQEALEARQRALSLDPLSEQAHAGLADTLFLAGHLEKAERELDRLAELAPDFPTFHLRARISLARGSASEALEQISREPLGWRRLYIGAIARFQLGQTEQAREALLALIDRYGEDIALQAAIVNAQLGDTEEAFNWLAIAQRRRDPGLIELAVEPELTMLHDDARFTSLLKEIGLPSPQPPAVTSSSFTASLSQ